LHNLQKLPERQDIFQLQPSHFFVLPFRQLLCCFFPQVDDQAVMKILTFQVNHFKLFQELFSLIVINIQNP